jgi:pyruvate dehydrogenase E1 component beta subunit
MEFSIKRGANRHFFMFKNYWFKNGDSEIWHYFKYFFRSFDYLDAPIVRINTADTPLHYAPTLIEAWIPNPQHVINAVKDVMYVK